ncbi:hypothetical protein F0562_020742 [Nyssa sinensis]|uniref:Uncharacterized protein n=1 Tax=Nyssa sinensis TaxID=561372 RepID=A0A5J5BVJ6_9ASTE|nr:hypothetical protein F0562_020742 [Nyssa sinensis]
MEVQEQPFQQVILDYDYTFTTPYCGSETVEINAEKHGRGATSGDCCSIYWEDCKEQIDLVTLASKEPVLFYDELRVAGVLMRLRDTPLSAKGHPSDSAAYSDPSIISQRLPIIMHKNQKLKVPGNLGRNEEFQRGADYSRRFKSSFCGSNGCSDGCGSNRKLPGHFKSTASSSVCGAHANPNPVFASLNLATVVVPPLLGLCTSEWGRTPSDRTMEVLMGIPIIVIIL